MLKEKSEKENKSLKKSQSLLNVDWTEFEMPMGQQKKKKKKSLREVKKKHTKLQYKPVSPTFAKSMVPSSRISIVKFFFFGLDLFLLN